jgi:D-glycero-alpha-D-manno-heptose-7-phosphate kinase
MELVNYRMIIARCPLRVSIVGGGTDLPLFSNKYVGNTTTIAINKYVYLIAHRNFNSTGVKVRYSKIEKVNDTKLIKHNIFRQVLSDYHITDVEISSVADIRSGSGLGSSSSFTNALLAICKNLNNENYNSRQIAYESSEVEIKKLGYEIGLQDHFSTALGGIQNLTFESGTVKNRGILLKKEIEAEFINSIILIDTGSRNRDEINRNQRIIQKLSKKKIDDLNKLRDLSMATSDCLNQGDIDSIGKLIARSWEIKQETHMDLFTPKIKNSLNSISNLGAKSFKLLGSGKGGFIFVYERNPKIRKELVKYFNKGVLPVGIDKAGLVNIENGIL